MFVVVLMVAVLCWIGLELSKRQLAQYVPLRDAIASLNTDASDDPVGRLEPRLTEEEVVAAISRQLPKLIQFEDVQAIYERIADTRTIPNTAYFNSMNSYRRAGVTNPVWWVNLQIEIDPVSGYGFGLRVRENNAPKAAVEAGAATQ